MLIALLIAAGGVFALHRFSGKSPASLVVILILLGLAGYVFMRVQGGVMGGLQKQVG